MRKDLLAKAAAGTRLSRDEAREVGRDLAGGRSEPLQCAAFLAALAARGETPEEVAGLAEAFRETATPMQAFPKPLIPAGQAATGGTRSTSAPPPP